MLRKIKKREFKIWLVLTIVVLLSFASFTSVIINNRQDNEAAFLKEKLNRFEGDVNSTLATYEVFSNYIFEKVNSEEVKEIMYQASFASAREKDILREQLYNKLAKTYNQMKDYNYRQFHFHLPNTESFLRLHRPDKYGDLLYDVRESVKIANRDEIFVSGFEEGRIFNGFRHVYPITYNNTHVGSVEISVSTASIIEVLSSNYSSDDFYFIMDKKAVDDNVFSEERSNYKQSQNFKNFYVDLEVEDLTLKNNKVSTLDSGIFFSEIDSKYGDKIDNNESFSISHKFNDKDCIVNFLAINNFKNLPIAYIISVSESVGYEIFTGHMYLEVLLVSILVLTVLIFTYILSKYQYKLRSASEVDYLTNIYNRKKFYQLANKEIQVAKRYNYPCSLLLFDIDHFKKINDKDGHGYGDQVLVTLSSEILKNIRSNDILARWGGEEFVLFLSHTSKSQAILAAEKIRKVVADSSLSQLKDVTISIGVSEVDLEAESVDKAIKQADKAMYCAKNKGRNQVYPKE